MSYCPLLPLLCCVVFFGLVDKETRTHIHAEKTFMPLKYPIDSIWKRKGTEKNFIDKNMQINQSFQSLCKYQWAFITFL